MFQIPDNSEPQRLDPLDLQRIQTDQPPVLVVGMHNSGTSILTEILHKNGIFFGANMHHFESYFFSNFINDRLILGGGGNWAQLPLLSEEDVLGFADTVGPFIKKHWIADYLQWGYDGKSPWGIKDPRLCILLPLYLKIFPDARVIHIRRDPNDVAASLSAKYKAGVGVLPDFEHWRALTNAYTQRVLDYANQCRSYIELSYEEFCREPEPLARDLFQKLDLPYTDHASRLLKKVTPSRIGSYQRMIEAQNHPLRSRFKAWLSKLR